MKASSICLVFVPVCLLAAVEDVCGDSPRKECRRQYGPCRATGNSLTKKCLLYILTCLREFCDNKAKMGSTKQSEIEAKRISCYVRHGVYSLLKK